MKKRIAIEAASKFGWTRYIKNDDYILGMNSFGSSAPHKVLYNNFGLNSKELVKLALRICKKKIMINIAINGFGRIGRLFLRALSESKNAKKYKCKNYK